MQGKNAQSGKSGKEPGENHAAASHTKLPDDEVSSPALPQGSPCQIRRSAREALSQPRQTHLAATLVHAESIPEHDVHDHHEHKRREHEVQRDAIHRHGFGALARRRNSSARAYGRELRRPTLREAFLALDLQKRKEHKCPTSAKNKPKSHT